MRAGFQSQRRNDLAYVRVSFDKGVDHILTYRHLLKGNDQEINVHSEFVSLSL